MPNCTVDRNLFGSCASASAFLARSSPSSARCCRRTLRAATTAISDMAKHAVGEDEQEDDEEFGADAPLCPFDSGTTCRSSQTAARLEAADPAAPV